MSDAPANDDTIVVDCDLDEPADKVWRALTQPDLLGAWLGANDIKPEVGARFTVQAPAQGGGEIDCEVLDVEPEKLLRYSWRGGGDLDSVVTFEISETDAGVRLRISHAGLAGRTIARLPSARRVRGLRATPRMTMCLNQRSLKWAA